MLIILYLSGVPKEVKFLVAHDLSVMCPWSMDNLLHRGGGGGRGGEGRGREIGGGGEGEGNRWGKREIHSYQATCHPLTTLYMHSHPLVSSTITSCYLCHLLVPCTITNHTIITLHCDHLLCFLVLTYTIFFLPDFSSP